ncbi:29706_t:CDS:2, partial [Racocetra persica]
TGDRATTKAGGDKSLFENIVENKLGNSQTVGKGYGQANRQSLRWDERICLSEQAKIDPVCRCLNNQLVCKIVWTNGIQKLAGSAKFSRDCKTGSISSSAWPSEFRKFVEGFLGSSVYRQSYSTSDNE